VGLLYRPWMMMMMLIEVDSRIKLTGKPKYSHETCPSATLFNTNPKRPYLGSNPDCRGGKPSTNRLSYFTSVCGESQRNMHSRVAVWRQLHLNQLFAKTHPTRSWKRDLNVRRRSSGVMADHYGLIRAVRAS
jgi:hypothetical protein